MVSFLVIHLKILPIIKLSKKKKRRKRSSLVENLLRFIFKLNWNLPTPSFAQRMGINLGFVLNSYRTFC